MVYQQKPMFSVQRFCNSGLDIGAVGKTLGLEVYKDKECLTKGLSKTFNYSKECPNYLSSPSSPEPFLLDPNHHKSLLIYVSTVKVLVDC